MGEQQRHRRVTIVDDHSLFAELIGWVLERRGYLCRLIDTDSLTSTALARKVVASRPEMVVASLDLHSVHSDGSVVLHDLAKAGHRVLALLEGPGETRHGEALAFGAHAVAAKTMPLNEFLALVRKTMRGVPVIEREERTRLAALYHQQQLGRMTTAERLKSLSTSERRVLLHLMAGHSVHEVANLDVLSEHTVRTQVRAVLTKLGASSQVQAVAIAWHNGWGRGELLQGKGLSRAQTAPRRV